MFVHSVEETAASLQWDVNIKYFTGRPTYRRLVITVRHLASFLTEWGKSQRRFVGKFKAHTSCKVQFVFFFPRKSCRLRGYCKNTAEPGRRQMAQHNTVQEESICLPS